MSDGKTHSDRFYKIVEEASYRNFLLWNEADKRACPAATYTLCKAANETLIGDSQAYIVDSSPSSEKALRDSLPLSFQTPVPSNSRNVFLSSSFFSRYPCLKLVNIPPEDNASKSSDSSATDNASKSYTSSEAAGDTKESSSCLVM